MAEAESECPECAISLHGMLRCALLGLLLLPPAFGEYAEVRGIRMYYEVHGKGRPVVLLHGGLNTIETSFAKQIPVLSQTHRVIAIEQMAHGRTRDVPGRKLSYEEMALDTAALLKHLGIQNADLVGWSDGGQLALRLAFTHPQLVRRVFVSGVGLGASPDIVKALGAKEAFPKLAASMFPEGFEFYKRLSPDGPDHWAAVTTKGWVMWTGSSFGFTESELGKIELPVMIVAGDQDFAPIEETVRIFRAIPRAKLYLLPGTGHATFQDRPAWINLVLLDFLDRD